MNLFESIRIALDMLRLHKLRAFLTMLGVIIGVMSVTMITLLSEGFKGFIGKEFERMAPDCIMLFYDPGARGHGQRAGRFEAIKEEEKQYILDRVKSIGTVSGMYMGMSQTARAGSNESKDTSVTAVDENYTKIVIKTLLKGRFLDKSDMDSMANSAVISDALGDQLFPGADPMGQVIQLNGISFTVVGITKYEKSSLQMGGGQSRTMDVPITTAQRKWLGGRSYSILMMRPKPGESVEKTMDDIWHAMMARTGNVALYRLDSNESILGVFTKIIGGAGAVLAAVAALSLLVGGIGIMNIMLVSVTERTREIGLRKAVGGKQSSILTQFLIEAAMLSLVGGLIGMGMAWALGQLIAPILAASMNMQPGSLQAPFPIVSALQTAGFSALIGMVFGFFPAVSAARLDPIVALRYE